MHKTLFQYVLCIYHLIAMEQDLLIHKSMQHNQYSTNNTSFCEIA